MSWRLSGAALAGAAALLLWVNAEVQGQQNPNQAYQLHRFYYYPYYYFPHNYWPAYGPRWPEPPNSGQPMQRYPAYMAYPPFLEPKWRYEMWQPQRFYSGFHFWLDQL
jgi:hypothetical protein